MVLQVKDLGSKWYPLKNVRVCFCKMNSFLMGLFIQGLHWIYFFKSWKLYLYHLTVLSAKRNSLSMKISPAMEGIQSTALWWQRSNHRVKYFVHGFMGSERWILPSPVQNAATCQLWPFLYSPELHWGRNLKFLRCTPPTKYFFFKDIYTYCICYKHSINRKKYEKIKKTFQLHASKSNTKDFWVAFLHIFLVFLRSCYGL